MTRRILGRWRVLRIVTAWCAIPYRLASGAREFRTWRQALDHALRDGRDQ